jgi:hypothetical protein
MATPLAVVDRNSNYPLVYPARFYVTAGGLPSRLRRLFWQVDRILKGEKPVDLRLLRYETCGLRCEMSDPKRTLVSRSLGAGWGSCL